VKQAVILAGGKGTRLKERLGGLPKPLIDVCGIPLLEHQINLLKSQNFDNILILVNYESEKIIEFCKSKNNWGLNILCIDDGEPLGTAGAILRVYDLLQSEFLVVYGDTMLNVDLNRFYEYHNQHQSSVATLFLHPNDHPSDSDLVELDINGLVLGFHPYPHDSSKYYPNLVNAALYWIRKEALLSWKDNNLMLDFGKNLFPMMLKKNFIIRGYNSIEYIKDGGTPSRIDKICGDLLSGKIKKSNLNNLQKAIFIDRDGTINKEIHHLNHLDKFELLPRVASAIKLFNESDYLSCVVTNQPVVARGDCSLTDLSQIHNKMETLIGFEGAYVDRIYYCPHHPDKGYEGEVDGFKIDCNCRKPKTGLVDRAVEELNINRDSSWFIGDTSTDMLTAKNAGLKSILVQTGFAGLDQKYLVLPDFIVPDLNSAASFILDTFPILYDFCLKISNKFKAGEIVFVGGFSRSGKTTFSNVIREALKEHRLHSHVISLDRWLKSESERQEGVLGRYDLEAILNLLSKVSDHSCRPVTLDLPFYNKLKKEQIASVEKIVIQKNDIVIIEGTIALQIEFKIKKSHRFYINLNENSRKDRVTQEYLLRKYSIKEANKIYNDRQIDEIPVIEKTSNFININMDKFYK
jgi:histidinol-phosphate phosphatase family protein